MNPIIFMLLAIAASIIALFIGYSTGISHTAKAINEGLKAGEYKVINNKIVKGDK